MSANKKAVRARFRDAVFKRDGYLCKVCKKSCDLDKLDAHHITDRNDMPNGGYVLENGITLCPECHIKAEAAMKKDLWFKYSPEKLYKLIGSDYKKALEASEKLKDGQ